jgi:predicted phosphoadenosine phosphosulfate sulfurtransferase
MANNVHTITQERLDIIFNEFDNIYVSFSGGKDSGILLNLCIDYIRKNNLKRKIGLFHIDYEAQYQMTTDYVDKMYSENSDILDYYRVCLPISAQCSTSMSQDHWTPWDEDNKDIWVRDLPVNSINMSNHTFDFFKKGMWDYTLQEEFSTWIHKEKKATKTLCLVGIRTQESLNRWRAIHSDKNYKKYNNINWTKKMADDVYNGYPIFDWITEDVWTANYKFDWSYNKLYDIFWQAGLTIHQMRVASPFNDYASASLKMFKVIEPNTWGKLISRVNGVNFTGIYGGTTAMGWQSIKLPKGHTWKSYMQFLLSTLPKAASDNYTQKLEVSINFWRKKGGVLDIELINKLVSLGIELEVKQDTNYKTDKRPVTMEYLDDIDLPEFKQLPSYKRMCICIMKNDHTCKYMGFSPTKKENDLRINAENKYKNI